MEPVFPAVTCTVQASILSGKYPTEHGIIANGLYDRSSHSVSFWEQPSALVQRDRVWDILKQKKKSSSYLSSDVKTAVLFFSEYNVCQLGRNNYTKTTTYGRWENGTMVL